MERMPFGNLSVNQPGKSRAVPIVGVHSLNAIVVTLVDPFESGARWVKFVKSYEKISGEHAMYLLLIGLVGLTLKYFEVGPFAAWSWWVMLIPFALAVAWWAWADSTGYTKRKEIEKMDLRKKERIEKQRAAMGMLPKRRK